MDLTDINNEFVATVFKEAREVIKDRLDRLSDILEHLDPPSFEAISSVTEDFSFDSIHCDTYNRFAEKVSVYFLILFVGKYSYIFTSGSWSPS